jgi:hypothetical protein
MYRIIGADGREYGPITADQLRQWIAEGRANAQTKVLPEGTTEWRTLGELPEFLATSQPITPPPMSTLPAPPSARPDQVDGPAIALMVVAILGLVLQTMGLVVNLIGPSFMTMRQMPNEPWARMFSGAVGAAVNGLELLINGFILLGAIKMRKLENYGLVIAATIVAMIPCNWPCCILGLPIGIWTLVVLSKPEVKSAFH